MTFLNKIFKRKLNKQVESQMPARSPKELSWLSTYEKLKDISYNQHLSKLKATIQLDGGTGIRGQISTTGSTEYVRFFIDKGNGYENAGFTKFQVYDPEVFINPAALRVHEAELYFENSHLSGSKEIKIRAILSWNVLPPADPQWVPCYGDVSEKVIQMKPSEDLFGELLTEIRTPKLYSMDYAF